MFLTPIDQDSSKRKYDNRGRGVMFFCYPNPQLNENKKWGGSIGTWMNIVFGMT